MTILIDGYVRCCYRENWLKDTWNIFLQLLCDSRFFLNKEFKKDLCGSFVQLKLKLGGGKQGDHSR